MEEKNERMELLKKAFECKNQKEYSKALEFFEYSLNTENKNPEQDAEILSQMAQIYLILKDLDKALLYYQKALSIDNNHKTSLQGCFDVYFEKEMYQKALNLAQKICENDKNPVSYFNYFKTLYKLSKYNDIIEIFNTLDENIKLDADILYIICLVSPDNKKEVLLQKIIDIDETHKSANLDLAKIAFEKEDYEKVVKCCINLDENIPIVPYYLGIIEYKKKNYNSAVKYLINAIKLDNNEHDYYFDLAKVYIDIAYYIDALLALKTSINYSLINNKKESLDEKYFLAGWILYKNEQYQNSALNLSLVHKDSKYYLESSVLLQAINLQNKNLSKAKSELEKIYKKEKENIVLIDTLALVYKNLKMHNKALEMYLKALKLHPDSLFYKLELIDLYIDIHLYDDAMALINDVIKTYQNCANIYNSLARIYFRLKDYKKALEGINQYLELDKNNAESYYFKGLILNELKDFKNAKTAIYQAISLKPTVAKYYSQMARSYFELGEYSDALLYAKEAIELDKDDVNFKKQGYQIALKIGNKEQILLYERQLKRSEKLLKLKFIK